MFSGHAPPYGIEWRDATKLANGARVRLVNTALTDIVTSQLRALQDGGATLADQEAAAEAWVKIVRKTTARILQQRRRRK